MISKDEIRKYIEKNNPTCKSNSCNAYVTSIFKILERYEKEYNTTATFKTLNKYNNIIKILPEKLTTKKNYLTAILVATRNKKDFENVYKKYLDYTHIIKGKYDKIIDSQKKSGNQKKNWVSWKQLVDVKDDLWEIIKDRRINKKKDISNRDKKILQQYVIASLYLLQPPRRSEYATMKLIKEKPYFKLTSEQKKDNNWLVVKSRNTKYFVFTRFKTDKSENKKHHGDLKKEISPALNSILNLWLRHNTGEWLLYDNRGNKMSNNNIVKALQRIFSPTGKIISVSMIRHIYKSEKGEGRKINLKKLKQEAKDMGHSVDTSLEYVKKD